MRISSLHWGLEALELRETINQALYKSNICSILLALVETQFTGLMTLVKLLEEAVICRDRLLRNVKTPDSA